MPFGIDLNTYLKLKHLLRIYYYPEGTKIVTWGREMNEIRFLPAGSLVGETKKIIITMWYDRLYSILINRAQTSCAERAA